MNSVLSGLATPTRSIPRWVLSHLVLVVAATAAGAYAEWRPSPLTGSLSPPR